MPSMSGWSEADVISAEMACTYLLAVDKRHPGELDSVLVTKLTTLHVDAVRAHEELNKRPGKEVRPVSETSIDPDDYDPPGDDDDDDIPVP